VIKGSALKIGYILNEPEQMARTIHSFTYGGIDCSFCASISKIEQAPKEIKGNLPVLVCQKQTGIRKINKHQFPKHI